MNVTFANGTTEQQGVVEWVFANLLNLDLARFTLNLTVEFVPNPDPGVHNEVAFTEVSTGVATMSIRDDFPHFPTEAWDSIEFAQETVAHELGHALLGQLPTEVQDEIFALFGTDRSDFEDDSGQSWEDRLLEGVVETFKDTFLRQRDRAYANRTNIKLPIYRYPAFRSIFRRPIVSGGVLLSYVYGGPDYRVDEEYPDIELPVHFSENDDQAFVFYGVYGLGVDLSGDVAGSLPGNFPGGSAYFIVDSALEPSLGPGEVGVVWLSTFPATEMVTVTLVEQPPGGGEVPAQSVPPSSLSEVGVTRGVRLSQRQIAGRNV